MLKKGTKIWYSVNELKNRTGIVLGWYYDSFYIVKCEKGSLMTVYPEHIVSLIK